jgi:hypothetical protein
MKDLENVVNYLKKQKELKWKKINNKN